MNNVNCCASTCEMRGQFFYFKWRLIMNCMKAKYYT